MTFGIAASFLSGCGYFFGPKANEAAPLKLEVSQKCLESLGSDLRIWIEDGEPTVGRSIDCAVSSIDEFSTRTRGRKEASWSRSEINQFISTYLIDRGYFQASDAKDWTESAFLLKQILFGGQDDFISKQEIARLRDLLVGLKPALVEISPVLRWALFSQKVLPEPDNALEQAKLAATLIERIGTVLTTEMHRANGGQPTLDFEIMRRALVGLGVRDANLREWIFLAKAVKGFALGGDDSGVSAEEWPNLVDAGTQAWSIAVRIRAILAKDADPLGRDLGVLDGIMADSFLLLEKSVRAQGRGSGELIALPRWFAIVDALEQKKFIPFGLRAESLKRFLPTLFGKMLSVNGRRSDRHSDSGIGLSIKQVALLKDFYADWSFAQSELLSLVNDGTTSTPIAATEAVQKLAARSQQTAGKPQSLLASKVRDQLKKLLVDGRPLVRDLAQRQLFVRTGKSAQFSREDFDHLNLNRLIASFALRAYARDPLASEELSGLLESEAQELYLDVRELGREMGFIDPRGMAAGIRSFMEASIFMSVSDGNNRIGLHEAVEWLHSVRSAGLISDRIHDSMREECGLEVSDSLGKPKLEVNCFRQRLATDFEQHFSNMPELITWYKKQPFALRTNFVLSLENAGRPAGAEQEPVDIFDLRAMIAIVHYVENIFTHYDLDGNLILEGEEPWRAFPLLQPFIKKMGKGLAESETIQCAIFSYLLTFGVAPEATLVGGGKLLAWSVARRFRSDTAQRDAVLKVVASFAAVARRDREALIRDYHRTYSQHLRNRIQAGDTQEIGKMAELFQCVPEAVPVLGQVFGNNLDQLAPRTSRLSSEEFVVRGKRLIREEGRLDYLCLPF